MSFWNCFNGKSSAEAKENPERLKEELADVLIYSYMMADNLGFDVDQIIKEIPAKNEMKYPVNKSKGHREKYNQL